MKVVFLQYLFVLTAEGLGGLAVFFCYLRVVCNKCYEFLATYESCKFR